MERVPMLEEVGSVIRINHMLVEVFSRSQCVTMLEGWVGDNWPINTMKWEDMNWVEVDDSRVMELRKVRTFEEMVREF
jgi:hypothetical protein